MKPTEQHQLFKVHNCNNASNNNNMSNNLDKTKPSGNNIINIDKINLCSNFSFNLPLCV